MYVCVYVCVCVYKHAHTHTHTNTHTNPMPLRPLVTALFSFTAYIKAHFNNTHLGYDCSSDTP